MLRASTALLAALAMACSTIRPTVPSETGRHVVAIDPDETDDCMRPSQRFAREHVVAERLDDPELARELDGVPLDVRRTARAVGLEPHLARLLRARRTGADDHSVEIVGTRLQVVLRISSVEIELGSLLFEADCTGDQMEAALDELAARQGRQTLAFTIASIAVGAAAGIATGVIDARGGTPAEAVGGLGISGGVATAALGVGALVPRRGRVVFPHERNLFVPILRGEDPDGLYPVFVFQMLQASRVQGHRTPREELLADWDAIIDGTIAARDRELARTVLYGNGGVYDSKLVDVRERMYDALESQLNAFDRDLELLYAYFGKVLQGSSTTAP